MRLAVILFAVALVTILLPATLSVQAVAPNNVVRVRDYAVGDCVADDTAAVQQSENAWAAGQKVNSTGLLDFGTGCYRLTSTLHFAQTDGTPIFGTVRGDGPSLAVIKASSGIGRAIEMDDLFNGQVSGLTIQGNGYGTYAAGSNADLGLVLAARHTGLGTCCGTFHDLAVQGFSKCLVLGDDAAPQGAAAELVLSQVTTQYCGIGFYLTGYNTLDFNLIQPHMVFDGVGLYADTAYQITVDGGSSTGDTVDFHFLSPGNLSINGFRSETRHDVTKALVQVGGTTGQRVMISNSTFDATSNPAPVAMTIIGGPSFVTLESNFFNGKVMMQPQAGSLIAHHNAIRADNNQPFDIASGSWLDQAANWKPQEPTWWGEWFGSWWPFATGFVGSATSTPTPVATATPAATATALPTSTPVPAVWTAPPVLSVSADVGGPASCAYKTTCYWSTYLGDATLTAHFTSAQTFEGFRFTGSNAGAASAPATLTLSGSTDGTTWTQITQAVVNPFTSTWQTWTLPSFARVTYPYLAVRVQSQGIALENIQLLEP